jgi:hypothetical protein
LQAPVYFPTELTVTPAGTSLLPGSPLPMRTDRETIYLTSGPVPANARVALSDSVRHESLEWKLSAAIEQPGATFLPGLTQQLESTGGLTNSLAGMTLFQLAQVDFSNHVSDLAQRGQLALQRGDVQQARKISNAVTQADPGNEDVRMLRNATGRLNVRPVKQVTTGADPAEPTPDLEPRVGPNSDASLLDDQEERIRVQTQKLRNEVSHTIETARRTDDPETGLGMLKQTL